MLSAWQDSPARLRADANLEADLAAVGYRDRVVVELAQNAADAAAAAGIPGVLRLTVADAVLRAANTGAPLDAAGVESLAVSRASAKRDTETVGRFGVGFAAVLSVSDRPSIRSSTGSVAWSAAQAAALAGAVPELSDELARRGGRAPVLRLPFPTVDTPPAGFATEVVLPLRDAAALEQVIAQLRALDPLLLVGLPALARVDIDLPEGRRSLSCDGETSVVLHDGDQATRWWIRRGSGRLPPDVLDQLPVETRAAISVSWAVPLDASGRVASLPEQLPRVVRAPTPTDDPLTVPAVLVATYPLDATRRRVTTGAAADVVTELAAQVFAEVLCDLGSDPSVSALLPAGLPQGELDAAIHDATTRAALDTPWLPVAVEPDARQRPGSAVVVDDRLVDALTVVVPTLLPPGWDGARLAAVGVRRPSTAEIVAALDDVSQPAVWWRRLYDALSVAVPAGPDRDALGSLRVPLAGGGYATGPRTVALPTADTPTDDLSSLGIRVAHPDAVHPLLGLLGATDGTPAALLDQGGVRAAVEASYDDPDPEPVAAAVLALVAAARAEPGTRPWLADLALPDATGDWRPAGELLLSGGAMARWVATDSPLGVVDTSVEQRWGTEALRAVGVIDGPAILVEADVLEPDHDLDGESAWWQTLPDGATVAELVAVRDLEQLSDDAWPEVLAALSQAPLRAAVVGPALLLLSDGSRTMRPSYTAWWLSRHPVLDGERPDRLCLPDADPAVRALLEVSPQIADPEFLRAIGVADGRDDVAVPVVLDRLADPTRDLDVAQVRRWHDWLADRDPVPPDRVRAVLGDRLDVVDAEQAVVVDAPDLLPLLGSRGRCPVALSCAAALADAFDLPMASELASFDVLSTGRTVDDAVIHDELIVADVDGRPTPVPWRYLADVLHVSSTDLAFGLGRGRSWRDEAWGQRHRRTEELADPSRGTLRAAETSLDEE